MQVITRRLINKKVLVSINTSFRSLATKFAASHEYIKLDGDVGTVGITEHAAKALGDVVFVDLPSIGAKYSAGDSFGSVESVKAASDVYAPVSGEVVAINEALTENPATVNDSPLEKGKIIIMIKLYLNILIRLINNNKFILFNNNLYLFSKSTIITITITIIILLLY